MSNKIINSLILYSTQPLFKFLQLSRNLSSYLLMLLSKQLYCLLNIYVHIYALLPTLVRKVSLLYWVVLKEETHYCSKCWEKTACKYSAVDVTLTDRQMADRQTHSKSQATSGERGWKECTSWWMERNLVKYCLLDMAWLLHAWMYSSCAYLHHVKPVKHSSVGWGQFSDASP